MATFFLLKPNIKLSSVTNQYPMITQLSHITPLPKSLNVPRLIINHRLTLKCSVTRKNLNKPVVELVERETRRNPNVIVPSVCSEKLLESISVDGGPPSVTHQNNNNWFGTFLFSTYAVMILLVAIGFATSRPDTRTSVIKLQVGLLGSAMTLQRDLNLISKKEGRTTILTETILAILRRSDYCISGYSSVDIKHDTEDYKRWFRWLSIEERGKLDEDTLINLNNINKQSTSSGKSAGVNNEYIVVTILLVAEGVYTMPSIISSSGDLKEALKMLCTIPINKLLQLQVIWNPLHENEALTEREMLMDYPHLHFYK